MNKDPRDWAGWDKHNRGFESIRGSSAVFDALNRYIGRCLYWSEGPPSHLHYFTVVRWDVKSKTHFYVGTYKNGHEANAVFGITPR